MKIRMIMQTPHRTISILENDQGKPIARTSDPGLITVEELLVKAREYKQNHPEDFKKDFSERKKRNDTK